MYTPATPLPPNPFSTELPLYEWKHQQTACIAVRKTCYQFKSIPWETLQSLIKIAKAREVTIGALLQALLLLSAQHMIGEPLNTGLQTPLNLRPWTSPSLSTQEVGFFCAIVDSVYFEIHEQMNVWELALACKTQLNARFQSLHFPTTLGHFNEFKHHLTYMKDPLRNYFPTAFILSNIGKVHFQYESPQLQVRALHICTSSNSGTTPLMLLSHTTAQGMTLTFEYCTPLISHKWVQQFIDYFMKQIEQVHSGIEKGQRFKTMQDVWG